MNEVRELLKEYTDNRMHFVDVAVQQAASVQSFAEQQAASVQSFVERRAASLQSFAERRAASLQSFAEQQAASLQSFNEQQAASLQSFIEHSSDDISDMYRCAIESRLKSLIDDQAEEISPLKRTIDDQANQIAHLEGEKEQLSAQKEEEEEITYGTPKRKSAGRNLSPTKEPTATEKTAASKKRAEKAACRPVTSTIQSTIVEKMEAEMADNHPPPLGDIFQVDPSTWKCEVCLVWNNDTLHNCIACDSRRPLEPSTSDDEAGSDDNSDDIYSEQENKKLSYMPMSNKRTASFLENDELENGSYKATSAKKIKRNAKATLLPSQED